jgi:hypothetical protein
MPPFINDTQCCCANCCHNLGYLKFIYKFRKKVYKTAWDKKTGFSGENGCRLPRELRSGVCIGHRCEQLSWKDEKLLNTVIDHNHHVFESAILEMNEKIAKTGVQTGVQTGVLN